MDDRGKEWGWGWRCLPSCILYVQSAVSTLYIAVRSIRPATNLEKLPRPTMWVSCRLFAFFFLLLLPPLFWRKRKAEVGVEKRRQGRGEGREQGERREEQGQEQKKKEIINKKRIRQLCTLLCMHFFVSMHDFTCPPNEIHPWQPPQFNSVMFSSVLFCRTSQNQMYYDSIA